MIDSTQLVQQLGDDRAAALWAEHDRRSRELRRRFQGLEIDRSDGFFLVFDTAANAAHFAIAYHQELAGLGLAARASLHVGELALRRNAPADVAQGAKPIEAEGLAKPLAARIMALAQEGQTLLSESAARALAGAVLPGCALHRHGYYRLHGIDEPEPIHELLPSGSAGQPPADGSKAYRVVRVEGLWQPVREVRHNLSPERDDFIGRSAELRALASRLGGAARLLTVLGTAGTGKTRLVRRYAHAWLGEWPGGVYFCDLSEARTLDGIHFAVALALGVPLGQGDAGAQLGRAIAARGRCLVILDNFEQLLEHAAVTLGQWIDRAAQARFAVTSRERLQLAGEQIFPIEPLLLATEAVELFEARARAQRPEFVVDDGNRDAVTEAVRLLDGLPLAIELAAARVRILSAAQIVQRLNDRFVLLAGAKGAAARQATLITAIDWSWELLEPSEQSALAQCSVFEGGFTLQAAEAVLEVAGTAPTIDLIQALVDKSLLRAWLPKDPRRLDIAEPYFGMYLSIHEYAAGKLERVAPAATLKAQQRHGRWFARFGRDEAMETLLREGGIAQRRKLALELDNLVSGCRRAMRQGQAEVAAACHRAASVVLEAQGPFRVGVDLGEQVVRLDGLSARQRALAWQALSVVLRGAGQTAEADAALEQALAAAELAQDRLVQAQVLGKIAVARFRQGRKEDARQLLDLALPMLRELGAKGQLALAMANLGNLQMQQGRMADARCAYEGALALHREVGNRAAEGIALGNLGSLLHELGHGGAARSAYQSALTIHREAGNLLQEAIVLANFALLLNEAGEPAAAAEHGAAALKIHREIGSRRNEGVVLGQVGGLHRARGEFTQARDCFEQALAIHREVGNPPFEGAALAQLGEVLVTIGQAEKGLRAVLEGERLLRSIDSPLQLAWALCVKGQAVLAGGDRAAAQAAVREAETISAALGAQPGSELGRALAALRALLAVPSG